MKIFNWLFGFVILACLGLSFVTPNNLNRDKAPQATEIAHNEVKTTLTLDGDRVTREVLIEYVNKELADPIRACMEKKNPHVFMTKCYSKVSFELDPMLERQKEFSVDRPIKGTLVFIDCSEPTHLGSVTVNYKKKTIMVKESFRSPEVKAKAFIKDMCQYINKEWSDK